MSTKDYKTIQSQGTFMLTNDLMNRIALFCYAASSRIFATRVKGTTEYTIPFSKLPEYVATYCVSNLHINVVVSKKYKAEAEKHAYDTALEITTNLIKWSGLGDDE